MKTINFRLNEMELAAILAEHYGVERHHVCVNFKHQEADRLTDGPNSWLDVDVSIKGELLTKLGNLKDLV